MHHALFKYFSNRQHAETFLDGIILFRSLAYFRDYEEQTTRGDRYEGTAKFRPAEGLILTNKTQGKTGIARNWSFESAANAKEIFVFCVSRSRSERMKDEFKAVACVEIQNIKLFCDRIKAALPANAKFLKNKVGKKVDYYQETDTGNPRWAVPELIALSKFKDRYAWQDEYRFLFSLTDALNFENVQTKLVRDDHVRAADPSEHQDYFLNVGSIRDIGRLHVFTS
jgi:hypothetical protein